LHVGNHAIGRLKAGVSLQQAKAGLATLAARLQREHPEFTDAMLAPVTADYLRQSLLVTALPAALSVAPVPPCQLSRCAPIITISSRLRPPGISPMRIFAWPMPLAGWSW